MTEPIDLTFHNGIMLSKTGFTELIVVLAFGSAVILSWLVGVLLWIFPRYETDYYHRRLVANMPRVRDENLPSELQLQTAIHSLTNTAGSVNQNNDSTANMSGPNNLSSNVEKGSPNETMTKVVAAASIMTGAPGVTDEIPRRKLLPQQPEKQTKQKKEPASLSVVDQAAPVALKKDRKNTIQENEKEKKAKNSKQEKAKEKSDKEKEKNMEKKLKNNKKQEPKEEKPEEEKKKEKEVPQKKEPPKKDKEL